MISSFPLHEYVPANENQCILGLAPTATENNTTPNGGSTLYAAPMGSGASLKPDYAGFMDDPMLAEFGWPSGEDIFSTFWADDSLAGV